MCNLHSGTRCGTQADKARKYGVYYLTFNQVVGGSNPPCLRQRKSLEIQQFQGSFVIYKSFHFESQKDKFGHFRTYRCGTLCGTLDLFLIIFNNFSGIFYNIHIDMSINIRSDRYIGVSHELLSGPDIDTGPAQIGTVRMTETVRDKIFSQGIRRYKTVTVHLASHIDIHVAP